MLRIPIDAGVAAGAPAWVEVDLGAVAHNVREFKRLLQPGCGLFAVVKANAYGHGMQRVAQTALGAGATGLAVANVREGEELRASGIEAPILVVGPMEPEEASAAILHELVPSLGSRDLATALAARARRPLPVHVEVDTGMRRHGVPAAELFAFAEDVLLRGQLQLAGVWTHFAAVDEGGVRTMRQQLQTFAAAAAGLRGNAPMRHAANSLATLVLSDAHLDAVRIGGGLYGFDPLQGRGPVRLRPALALKARIVGMRAAAAGDAVGYGATFRCARPSRLALLPLGYADGLSRGTWQGAEVLVHGERAPIVGLISMNQTVVDVTAVPRTQLGDEVVLLGEQGGRTIAAEERASGGGSVYEVTALLRAGLPRRYEPPRRGDSGAGPAADRAENRAR